MKGPQQVKSHLPIRNQAQAARASSVLDEKPHQSCKSRLLLQPVGMIISDWAQGVAQNPGDSGEGVIADYGDLLVHYFDEICAALQRHPNKSLVYEVIKAMDDLRQRFRLWNNGEPQLDQRLVGAPRIRNHLLIKLTVLTLDLLPGIRLYGPNIQTHLRRQTEVCVTQAVSLTGFALPDSREERSPADIIEFLDHAKCQDLKVRMNDIFGMLPEINHPFESLEAMEDRRPQINRINDRKLRVVQKPVDKRTKLKRKLRELIPTHLRDERSSRSANGGSIQPNEFSKLANSSITNDFPDLMDSSSDSSLSLDSINRKSAGPMTDTNTSTSPSRVRELDDDPDPFEPIKSRQFIVIQGPSGRDQEPDLALFDSGSFDNFIISSVVKKHNLDTYPLLNGRLTYRHINKTRSYTDKYVRIRWRLSRGKKWHESNFLVIDHLPDSLNVLVGSATSAQAGICLRARLSALPTFREKNEATSAQEQRQYTLQTLNGSIRKEKKFKLNQKRHADACRSSEIQKLQNLSLHDSSAKNQGHQQTQKP